MVSQQVLTDANVILRSATPEQRRWVTFRLTSNTDKEAAKLAKVHPTTVSRWENKADLDRAVALLLQDPIGAAVDVLGEAAIEAAQVLRDLLKEKDRHLRLRVANSILDRIGVSGTQRHEFPDGIDVKIFNVEEWKAERAGRLAQVAQLQDPATDETRDT
jgi:hypothetical protein